MHITRSVTFVPPNAKFLTNEIITSDDAELSYETVEEQIEKNPFKREVLRKKAKIRGDYSPSRKDESVIKNVSNISDTGIQQQTVQYAGTKEWVKNMTETEIYINFGVQKIGDTIADDKIVVKDFVHISKFGDRINHPSVTDLLQSVPPRLAFVTAAERNADLAAGKGWKREKIQPKTIRHSDGNSSPVSLDSEDAAALQRLAEMKAETSGAEGMVLTDENADVPFEENPLMDSLISSFREE